MSVNGLDSFYNSAPGTPTDLLCLDECLNDGDIVPDTTGTNLREAIAIRSLLLSNVNGLELIRAIPNRSLLVCDEVLEDENRSDAPIIDATLSEHDVGDFSDLMLLADSVSDLSSYGEEDDSEVDPGDIEGSLNTPALTEALRNRDLNTVPAQVPSPKRQKGVGPQRGVQFRDEVGVVAISPVRPNISAPITSARVNALIQDGHAYSAQGYLERALRTYRQAQRELSLYAMVDPVQKAAVHQSIGDVFVKMGRHQEARAELEIARVIQRDIDQTTSGRVNALIQQGHVYLAQGDLERALAIYIDARGQLLLRAEADPVQNVILHNSIGCVFIKMGRHQEAKAILEIGYAIEHLNDQWMGTIGYNLGKAYAALNDTAAAERVLQRAILKLSQDPHTQSKGLVILGNIYYSQGRMEEATRYYRIAYESPECPTHLKEGIQRLMGW